MPYLYIVVIVITPYSLRCLGQKTANKGPLLESLNQAVMPAYLSVPHTVNETSRYSF